MVGFTLYQMHLLQAIFLLRYEYTTWVMNSHLANDIYTDKYVDVMCNSLALTCIHHVREMFREK